MSEENKVTGRRFVDEVLNKQNLAALDELVAEEFVKLDPLPGQEQAVRSETDSRYVLRCFP